MCKNKVLYKYGFTDLVSSRIKLVNCVLGFGFFFNLGYRCLDFGVQSSVFRFWCLLCFGVCGGVGIYTRTNFNYSLC
jgi:hypothetical protein